MIAVAIHFLNETAAAESHLYARADGGSYASTSTCNFDGSNGTPICTGSSITADIGTQWVPDTTNTEDVDLMHTSAIADLTSAQVKVFYYRGNNGFYGNYPAYAQARFRDWVTFSLAPGASWPQTITVRAILNGQFSANGNVRAEVQFANNTEALSISQNIAASAPSFSQERAFALSGLPNSNRFSALLQLTAQPSYGSSGEGTFDYSSESNYGLRFEIILPAGLMMTSDTGVFYSQAPKPAACNNGLDDDADGFADYADAECFFQERERTAFCEGFLPFKITFPCSGDICVGCGPIPAACSPRHCTPNGSPLCDCTPYDPSASPHIAAGDVSELPEPSFVLALSGGLVLVLVLRVRSQHTASA